MIPHAYRQSGAALIIFLTIFVLGISAILLSELNNRTDIMLDDQAQTIQVLKQAKEALIGFAATYNDNSKGLYGFLPCPDINHNNPISWPEGTTHGSCGSQNESQLGRLPWKSLGLPPLRDGAGECLWYAVSGSYKPNPKTNMLNTDTNGLFKVFVSKLTTNPQQSAPRQLTKLAGNETLFPSNQDYPQERAVAVIIAPGKALPNQDRSHEGADICGGNYTASNYLDSEDNINNAEIQQDANNNLKDEKYNFITAQDNQSLINDRIVYITREELWRAIQKRSDFINNMQCLTAIATHCVVAYVKTNTDFSSDDKRLPWPAPLDLDGKDYRNNASYDDHDNSVLNLLGRLPNKVDSSNAEIGKIREHSLITQCDFTDIDPDSDFFKPCQKEYSALKTHLENLVNCNATYTPNNVTGFTDYKEIMRCNRQAIPQAERSKYAYVYQLDDDDPTKYILRSCNDKNNPNPNPNECKKVKNTNKAVTIFNNLWKNWKDHLFYAVADAYKPNAVSTTPTCDNPNDCLRLETDSCAAIVIFAGKRLDGQEFRYAPPPQEDKNYKNNINNYLEKDNATNYPGTHGNETYQQSDGTPSINDISYCIKL